MIKFIKKFFRVVDCPDCNWFIACRACSEKYAAIDEELKKKEKR